MPSDIEVEDEDDEDVTVDCEICPGPGCCCDDLFDAWRERDL